jgi:hypothetical protein
MGAMYNDFELMCNVVIDDREFNDIAMNMNNVLEGLEYRLCNIESRLKKIQGMMREIDAVWNR